MTSSKTNIVALSAKNGGGAFWGSVSLPAPTDSKTAIAETFASLGLVSDAGAVQSRNWTSTNVQDWAGNTVKVLKSDFAVTYQVTFLEALNAEVQKLVNGDGNVTATAAAGGTGNTLAVKVNADTLPTKEFVFDLMDGHASGRHVLPDAQVTAVADVTFAKTGAAAYQVTLTAFPDDEGNCVYEYYDDGTGEESSSSSSSAG